MDLVEPYIKFITVCDTHMHRHEYKEAFLVLSQVKYLIEKVNDLLFDNDFNSRAALCALLYGQPEEALRLTEMVNLNTPGYLLVQALRGWALKEIGYQKRANVLFNYVLNSVPDTDSVMDCLGAAISSKLLGSDLSKFFFEFAIEKFETLTGNDRKLNLLWGVFAHLKKSELETISSDRQKTLLKSLELTKESAEVYDYLGQTYYAQKQYDLALKCYLKSIEISPNCNFYRHIKVSFIYFYTGREEQAKTFVLRFLEQSRDLYIFYWILCPSIQLMKSNEHSEFEKYYRIGLLLYYSQVYYSSYIMLQKAKEYDPYNYKLCIFMCIVQRYLGLLDEAIQNLEELKNSKYQNDIPLNIILAELYTVSQDYEKAEEMYQKIIELTPNKSFSIYIYVKFLNKMNRLDDSLVQIKKAIELEPRKVKLLIMQALIYSSLKQLDKAYETYEEVLKINPNLQSTKYQLSQINFVLNNYQKSFDQMIQIKEGEVGYEKCISLLVKLFISYPHELTKEQLEYANTHLRDRITHHLKTLGESKKQKKKATQKQSKKGQDLESKGNNQANEKEANFNLQQQENANSQNNQDNIDENQDKSKNQKGKKNNSKKTKKGKKKGTKKVVEEQEEIQEEENIKYGQEEEEKQNNQKDQIEDEEIKLEKEQKNEKADEQQGAEGENEDQGIDEEREIQRLLEGQSDSLSELDEIDLEINESLTSPGSSSESTEDCYREYLQKIKEENIKDKQEIYEDYSNYFHKNQHSYTKLLNQARKIKIQNLFEGNDIDQILADELDKLKIQNNNEENDQILIEENNQNADDEIPVQDNNENLNNNLEQENEEQKTEENAQEGQSQNNQIEDEEVKNSIKKKKIKNKIVSNKNKSKKILQKKSKLKIKNSSKTKQSQQNDVKVAKKVKKVITKTKTQNQNENLKKQKKQKNVKILEKKEKKEKADEKVIKKQQNDNQNSIKKQNIQKQKPQLNIKSQIEQKLKESKKNQNKVDTSKLKVQKEVIFRKTRSQASTKDPLTNKKVKSSTLETTKQAKQNEKQSISKEQKTSSKVKVSILKTKTKTVKKQTKVVLKQIKQKKKIVKKTEIIKKAIKKDMTKRILRSSTKKDQKS
ncbi:tetratricopeptide repeat protein (macronuclear) [Tetrahymena thermophila SB210]|uniref:Tetratricopeptide repeat protein n=1 Tax=Tetrahymena thermophila (strain SB210) TaxID=312017 RepID=Q24HU5_TETTS|nr:tetratricopeptide repeat protein [Tetrahymena thermophila SB210]EAS07342.3 tetratricopeptide repeat protein [Tetrahymena thermophila SB210]|eukprot:XP_001027584.3 tetratricopeptide repeat protein [Tetrahymena thermophila SB210]